MCVIALLVQDADYVPLVREITDAGRLCIASTLRHQHGLEIQFRQAGVQILAYRNDDFMSSMCTLHDDGSGSVAARSLPYDAETDQDVTDMDGITSKLGDLAYRTSRPCVSIDGKVMVPK